MVMILYKIKQECNWMIFCGELVVITIFNMNISRKFASSFSGFINEIPGICVDNFENADRVRARAYFLSHCHSDHIQGLYTDVLVETLKKTNAYIYMSRPSAAIIENSHWDKSIINFIRILELGTTLVTLPPEDDRNHEEILLSVTVIPAGHCLGSVMFLFKTKANSILFTGDFRVDCNDVSKYGPLHDQNGDVLKIDVLYIDTTFIDDRYEHFPKRSTSIECAITEIKMWLNLSKEHRVALHTSARYGYEFLFNEIYEQLGIKVYVDKERWKVYSTMQTLVPGLTNDETCPKIHVCQSRSNISHSSCCPKDNNNFKYLYLHFSALIWSDYGIDEKVTQKISEDRINVCFPTHCSSSELKYFITYLMPKKVIGFCSGEKADLTFKYSNNSHSVKRESTSLPNGEVKKVKVDRKVDKKLLEKIFEL